MTSWSLHAPVQTYADDGGAAGDRLLSAGISLAFADLGLRATGAVYLLFALIWDLHVITPHAPHALLVRWGLIGLILMFAQIYARAWRIVHTAELVTAVDLAIDGTIRDLEEKLLNRIR